MKISTRRIEALLAERQMRMCELAEAAGLSRQSTSTVVRRGTCAPLTAGKLAAGLGVRVEEIIQKEV